MSKLNDGEIAVLREYLATIAEEDRLLSSVVGWFGELGSPTADYLSRREDRSRMLDDQAEKVNAAIRKVLKTFNVPSANTRIFLVDGQGIEACFSNMSVRRIEVEQ